MPGQSIRPSQFITTYGIGSIIECTDGPRIICTLNRSGLFDEDGRNLNPNDFLISDQRLSQTFLNNARILRIPTNAELNEIESRPIYRTNFFPAWSLCPRHGIIYRFNFENQRGCPECTVSDSSYRKSRREAMRFVKACRLGHLDDLDWLNLINHRNTGCSPDYIRWEGGGGALRNIRLVCPDCEAFTSMSRVYGTEHACTGRLPEESNARPGCSEQTRVVQRNAANLRIPDIITSLTIPPRDTRIYRILEQHLARIIVVNRPSSKAELLNILAPLIRSNLLPESVFQEIENTTEPILLRAMNEVIQTLTETLENTPQRFLQDEFLALVRAATYGAPPSTSSISGIPDFEVIKEKVKFHSYSNNLKFRVTPVNRLRVVMVQTGYRRIDPITAESQNCRYIDDIEQVWYPGVELFGEGIFLDLNRDENFKNHCDLKGPDISEWMNAWRTIGSSSGQLRILHENRSKFHPIFVWWHSLAHRLINAISIYSGYSSAAMRERIYLVVNGEQPHEGTGGILLYTVQPGGDGTMGGLISQVDHFEHILQRALDSINVCSNDPICQEQKFGPNQINGAACYACELVSETSCEHRNMFLDRNLLRRNLE